jgi:hypothetical protein
MLIETAPGQEHAEAWLYLSPREAEEVVRALAAGLREHTEDPEWHSHISDRHGRELIVAIDPSLDDAV